MFELLGLNSQNHSLKLSAKKRLEAEDFSLLQVGRNLKWSRPDILLRCNLETGLNSKKLIKRAIIKLLSCLNCFLT